MIRKTCSTWHYSRSTLRAVLAPPILLSVRECVNVYRYCWSCGERYGVSDPFCTRCGRWSTQSKKYVTMQTCRLVRLLCFPRSTYSSVRTCACRVDFAYILLSVVRIFWIHVHVHWKSFEAAFTICISPKYNFLQWKKPHDIWPINRIIIYRPIHLVPTSFRRQKHH